MLGLAISLEALAFAAMFGVGGAALGLSALALTLILLGVSLLIEQRQARLARSRQVWTYYALNDRLSARACARRRVGSEPLQPAMDASRLLWVAAMSSRRWERSLGRN